MVTHVEVTDDGVVVGGGLWTYRWGARRRPFSHPVATPAGHVLTRDAPEDHPWHHGLWFTIKFVNGENFWEEYDAYGVLRHDGPPDVRARPDGAVEVAGTVRWIRPDRTTVAVVERRRLTYRPLAPDAHAIDLHAELVPTVDTELDRTPFTTWGGYGGLAFRGRPDLHDSRLLVGGDDGGERPLEWVLGERGQWLDLSGLVSVDDGDAPVGITFLDASTNPNHPVPWYASTRADTYGDEGWSNFANAAFLWDGPRQVAAGRPITFDYRVVVHDGIWGADRCREAYRTWSPPR